MIVLNVASALYAVKSFPKHCWMASPKGGVNDPEGAVLRPSGDVRLGNICVCSNGINATPIRKTKTSSFAVAAGVSPFFGLLGFF